MSLPACFCLLLLLLPLLKRVHLSVYSVFVPVSPQVPGAFAKVRGQPAGISSGTELKSFRLSYKCLYPLSHLASPDAVTFIPCIL